MTITKDTIFSMALFKNSLKLYYSEVYEADINDGEEYGDNQENNNNDNWYTVY